MKNGGRLTASVLFFAVSSWAFSPPAWAQDTSPSSGGQSEEPTVSSRHTPSRLEEISKRLAILNEELRRELEDSRRSSEELASLLESSRAELASLQENSTALALRATSSEQELTALLTALARAQASLTSLEKNFAVWKALSDATIADLEASRARERWLCIALGALALGGWTAFILASQ